MIGYKKFLFKVAVGSIVLFVSVMANAATNNTNKVQYQVEIKQPAHHLAEITMLLPKIEEGHIDVMMPAWRPGKYAILPLANGVQNLVAKDSLGNSLVVNKIDNSTWRIKLKSNTKVEVSYQLYANELANRTRHIDSSHAYLDGVAVFLYSPVFRATPVTVELDVPRGWKSISAMTSALSEHSFSADNYDVLADSPIETGKHQLEEFKVDATTFKVLVWGAGNYSIKKMTADLKKLAETQKNYWGSFPFKNYVFIVHATSGAKGATEHLNSTVIQRPRWSFEKDEDYQKFLDTASHELVHSWNVKSYRPAGLVPYNYQSENFTKLLWFAEGGSSYLDTLFLLRSELVDTEYFLNKLAKLVHKYHYKPGRLNMSAADSSFNQWIATEGDRAINSSVNIYSQGEMLSLWLDLLILDASSGKQSLQQIHQKLFQQFPANIKGFSSRDLKRLITETGLKSIDELWSNYVEGTGAIPVTELLETVGLQLTYKSEDDIKLEIFTGIKLADGKRTVSQVTKNSPAWDAGITIKDEIVAINGIRVSSKNFKSLLNTFKSEQKISLSFFRNDELQRAALKLSTMPAGKPTLEIIPAASEKQKKLFENWLKVDYPESETDSTEEIKSE